MNQTTDSPVEHRSPQQRTQEVVQRARDIIARTRDLIRRTQKAVDGEEHGTPPDPS